MLMRVVSLWSPDIQPEIISPGIVLEEQAHALRVQTSGILDAQVRFRSDDFEDRACYTLEMLAPSLANSCHRIVTVSHSRERIFPCTLEAETALSNSIAHSEPEFREILRQVLQSAEVKSLALSLVARVRNARSLVLANADTTHVRKHKAHKRFRPAWAGPEHTEDDALSVDALYDELSGID